MSLTHTPRLNYQAIAPRPVKALVALSSALRDSTLGRRLIDLVLLRVSQINGCAFCIDMHWHDLIRHGNDPRAVNANLQLRQPRRRFDLDILRAAHLADRRADLLTRLA